MDAFEILVVILSVAFAVLLGLCIAFAVYLLRLIRHIDNLAKKAEKVAGNVEAVSEFFRKSAPPLAFSKIIANIIDSFKKSKREKK